jgi:hypothetical protein
MTVKRRNATRTIVGFIHDVEGGVILDKPVEGFRCWNIKDLRVVKP